MRKIALVLLTTFTLGSSLFGQELTLKEQAIEEFKKEHYDKAIEILERAVEEAPDDAEIYYYLGWYNHYLAYDSRPLKGYNLSYSGKIFSYLDKALELNPNYGDAKYFYGAECSGNAFNSMQNYDLEQLKYFYKRAFDKGAYPDWLIEFGKNLLNSCPENAILFVGGNADFDICFYLQLHQEFRKDITVIPIGNIDRPWYIEFLKNGLAGVVQPVKLSLTKNQIYDIHPFKWDTTIISIPLPPRDIAKYDLANDFTFNWQVNPDLTSQRQHAKIRGEKPKDRTYLSPQRAMLLQIVEENYGLRSICFSNLCNPFFYGGLDKYFVNCGLVSKLAPVDTKARNIQNNYSEFEKLLKRENLEHFSDIIENNLPRISGIAFSYHRVLYLLAEEYAKKNQVDKLNALMSLYDKCLQIGLNERTEKYYKHELEKLKDNIR
ncbi:MAG: hypothetical protein CR996_01070 [Draconibacterium sp.]|nr:MAG: hypothetical protein CR996_01070 [Draconibacterium sp.]PIF06561.1 MAG: hypothetical protein CSA36_00955 [Draconibacterium sp.]